MNGLTGTLMAEPEPATGPEKGPYTSTETRALRIAEPIELSFTTKQDVSHPPPSPWSAKSPPSPSAVAKDPYTCIEVKTLRIVGPIELTMTTTVNSSHVPPPKAHDDEDGQSLMDILQPLAQMIIARLDEIRRAQHVPPDPS